MFFIAIKNQQDSLKVERLYFTYRKLMCKEAYDILRDWHLAEDAVSESFIRIINNLHKNDESDCPRTRSFLVVICRNVAKDIYKKKTPVNEDEETISNISFEDINKVSDTLDILIKKETMEHIAAAIGSLDQIYRDVFLLRRVHGLSREEIASIFGINVETVKKRLTRAKLKIVTALEREKVK